MACDGLVQPPHLCDNGIGQVRKGADTLNRYAKLYVTSLQSLDSAQRTFAA